jgi:hypothetical protein
MRGSGSEATVEHYHAESKYPGHSDNDEDLAYGDLDDALRRVEENAAAMRANGYLVEQFDTGNDGVGVIREYHAAEQDGTPVATIEVRTCHQQGHV